MPRIFCLCLSFCAYTSSMRRYSSQSCSDCLLILRPCCMRLRAPDVFLFSSNSQEAAYIQRPGSLGCSCSAFVTTYKESALGSLLRSGREDIYRILNVQAFAPTRLGIASIAVGWEKVRDHNRLNFAWSLTAICEKSRATFDICRGLLLALQNSSQFSQSLKSPLNFLVARSYST